MICILKQILGIQNIFTYITISVYIHKMTALFLWSLQMQSIFYINSYTFWGLMTAERQSQQLTL